MADSVNPYDASDSKNDPIIPRKQIRYRLVEIAIITCIVLVLGALLLPATRRGTPEVSRRMLCSSNIRELSIAILAYTKDHQRLPPAFTTDLRGNPLHSWRTLILPFLEEHALYAKIDLSKPWDDPVHDEVRQAMPGVFACPSSKLSRSLTTYQAVIDDRSCLQPSKGRLLAEVVDGPSNTILLVETDSSRAVHWMKPQDINEKDYLFRTNEAKRGHFGGANVVMLDMAVRFIPYEIDKALLHAMITVDGGESEPLTELP